METLIGFAVGYLVGCQDGKDGVKRLRSTAEAIVTSDEFRRLTTEAVSLASGLARQAVAGRSLGSLPDAVIDLLARRGSSSGSRAA